MAITQTQSPTDLDAPKVKVRPELANAPKPFRRKEATELMFFPAMIAGSMATGAYLTIYYLTLALLPRAYHGIYHNYPYGPWADRLDLSMVFGTLVHPPYPSLLNWFIGLILLGGGLATAGVAYGLLLAWVMEVSDAIKGTVFGVAQAVVVGGAMWALNGFQPAIMREALPDVGPFFIGWTFWADVQQVVCWAAYGLVLGVVYRKLQQVVLYARANKKRA